MKVALLTIWRVGNYGAEMQTYATVKALRLLGHDVQVIDYRLNELKGLRLFIDNFLYSLTPASKKFNRFWSTYIPATKHFVNAKDLRVNIPFADLYLVGSDQVWNPAITKEKCLDYFLSFVPEGKQRAAYASSIGISKWNADNILTAKINKELKKFKAISCREKDGVGILKDVFNINAVNVLDPTLLFSGYPELVGGIKQKRTFVYYPLFGGKEMEEFCKETANKLHLQYVDNNPRKLWLRGRVWNRLSIEEWIKNFAEAEIVATQSFHGTAFSIIHGKQFFTVYDGSKVSRIANLLEELGIRDRLFPTVEAARKAKPWDYPIDYSMVNNRLEKLRSTSWNFLKNL